MKKLSDYSDDAMFYKGTIITIKDSETTPNGNFDKKYCMVYGWKDEFLMLDLYRSMGSCILLGLKPNVEGHYAVNKQGLLDWVKSYFKAFYTEEGFKLWTSKLDELVYIDYLEDHFIQANRDLFL